MTPDIEISEALYSAAKLAGEKEERSVSEQVQYWAKVGKACIDNPDLPIHFIQDALTSLSSKEVDLEPTLPRKPF
jgi:hypothetical protein